MGQYVVRQPIKDLDHNVIGYEILFDCEGGSTLYNHGDDRTAGDTIVNFLMQRNASFFDDRVAFLTFTPNLIFRNIPKIFEKNRLVIQIDDNVIVHPLTQRFLNKYKDQGYHIAFNDFQFAPRYFSIMDLIDFVRLNFEKIDQKAYENIITMARSMKKRVVAYNVNSKEAFDSAVGMQVDFFQGTYIEEPVYDESVQMDYLKSNFFQLIAEVTREEPDLNMVEDIISKDVSLTYALLKLVNSAYYALRNKATSIMQALVIMGLGQLKQWVYLLSFRREDDSIPEDLVKMSLLRANLCSALAPMIAGLPISKSEAYLMGMFSTLGYIMQVPLDVALNELNVLEEIKKALIEREGLCGTLFELVLSYEKADWDNTKVLAEQLGLQDDVITREYYECVESVNETWDLLIQS